MYLDNIAERKYKISLSKFRLSSHNLEIETGCYFGTNRSERICKHCHMNVVGDEYHFLLTCPAFRDLRIKYLKPYEPPHGKTNNLHMRKQRRRSASQ